MNGNVISGLLGGFAGTQAPGLIGKRMFESEVDRLVWACKREGSLADVQKDLRDYAQFSSATAQYMVGINYAQRPAGAQLLTALLKQMTPPNLAAMSTKEREEFLTAQSKIIVEHLNTMVGMPGAEVPTGAARAGMVEPLRQKYGPEFTKEVPTPTGYEKWAPETQRGFFKGYQAPRGKPATLEEAVGARLGRRPMPEAAPEYVEFMKNRDTWFRELPANDQIVVALLAAGSTAAERVGRQQGKADWWGESKEAFPALKSKEDLKNILYMDNPEDYDSSVIERASPEEKLQALAWIADNVNLSQKALRWLLDNWWFGRPTKEIEDVERMPWEEPRWWSWATKEEPGGEKGLLSKWGF
ncbi:MAG: hypothetical protein HWN68_18040 [Desulfobacterales bacterium]|nr:hypothetical protein [Desulfobacterales bacterium]